MELYDLSNVDRKEDVILHDMPMPVFVAGEGDIPCLCIGIGSLLQKTFSDHFRRHFKVYSSDLYWVKQPSVIPTHRITIERICRDVIDMAKQLKLDQYYLAGHSVYGGLAMEVAKYQPPGLCGVIGIGATPGWNEAIIQFKNAYFEEHASAHRKARFATLQAQYNQSKQATDSLVSVNAYFAESPKYFAKDVTWDEIQALWDGIDCDDAMANHLFTHLLADYDFTKNVDRIEVPVFVAGGQKDYDSVPLEIWQRYPTPSNFVLVDCGPVAHWPHFEAPERFDQTVLQWVEWCHQSC